MKKKAADHMWLPWWSAAWRWVRLVAI